MQLAERPPVRRDPREAFDYQTLFDGRSWRIKPNHRPGRTREQAYNVIRHMARRRGLKCVIEFDGDDLVVQATRREVAK